MNRAYYYTFTFRGSTPADLIRFFAGRCVYYGFNYDQETTLITGYVQFATNRLFPFHKNVESYTSQLLKDHIPPTTPWQFSDGVLRVRSHSKPQQSTKFTAFIDKKQSEDVAALTLARTLKRRANQEKSQSKSKRRIYNSFVQKVSREEDLVIKPEIIKLCSPYILSFIHLSLYYIYLLFNYILFYTSYPLIDVSMESICAGDRSLNL